MVTCTRKRTLFDVNFRPLNMSVERLEQRFRELVMELYSEEAVAARHRRFVKVYGGSFRKARSQPENNPLTSGGVAS